MCMFECLCVCVCSACSCYQFGACIKKCPPDAGQPTGQVFFL